MKKTIAFSLALTILFSCNKDKDDSCKLDTASVAGSYRITAVRYMATPTSAETDYYTVFFSEICERDDIITLNTNGNATLSDAGVKCTPPGDDVSTWSLSGNTITIDGGAANVDSHDCSAMTISHTNVFNAGDKLILVLTRQ